MSRRRRCTDAGGAREDGRENVVEERLRVDALALAHGRVDHAVDGHDAQGAPAAAAAREPGREVGALALPRAAVPPPQGPRVLPRLVDHDELVRRKRCDQLLEEPPLELVAPQLDERELLARDAALQQRGADEPRAEDHVVLLGDHRLHLIQVQRRVAVLQLVEEPLRDVRRDLAAAPGPPPAAGRAVVAVVLEALQDRFDRREGHGRTHLFGDGRGAHAQLPAQPHDAYALGFGQRHGRRDGSASQLGFTLHCIADLAAGRRRRAPRRRPSVESLTTTGGYGGLAATGAAGAGPVRTKRPGLHFSCARAWRADAQDSA